MSVTSTKKSAGLQPVDPIWSSIRSEAEDAIARDPLLTTFLATTILNQDSLEDSVIHRISERLSHEDVPADVIRQTFEAMVKDEPEWATTVRVDIQAYFDRELL